MQTLNSPYFLQREGGALLPGERRVDTTNARGATTDLPPSDTAAGGAQQPETNWFCIVSQQHVSDWVTSGDHVNRDVFETVKT